MRWKQLRRSLREPFVVLVLAWSRSLVGCLPYRALPRFARMLALALRCVPSFRKLTLANLAVAFPEKSRAERRRIWRENCAHLALTFLEFLWFDRHPERLKTLVDVSAPEAQDVLRRGRAGPGMIFLTPHLGNWEVSGQILAMHGVPFAAVAAPVKSRFVAAIMTRARTFSGMELIPEEGAVRGIVQAVRAGRSIGVLMDQNTSPRKGGIFVPFFALPAATSRAPAALARRLRLEICPGMLVREEGRLRLLIATMPKATAAYASDEELTRDLMAVNEQLIRRHPEQYVWFYKRWRYVPADVPAELRLRFPYYAQPYAPSPSPARQG